MIWCARRAGRISWHGRPPPLDGVARPTENVALGAFLLVSPTEGVSPCLAIGTADAAYYVDSQQDQLAFTAGTRAIEVQS